jgi:hypothetical protein
LLARTFGSNKDAVFEMEKRVAKCLFTVVSYLTNNFRHILIPSHNICAAVLSSLSSERMDLRHKLQTTFKFILDVEDTASIFADNMMPKTHKPTTIYYKQRHEDPFDQFPNELIYLMINHLSGRDVCQLQLASKRVTNLTGFHDLSQSFWCS